ncbi:MAG: 4-hydroxy-tetrahydrodipicolinate synthase [Verrucomicrobia bacterium]|nr:4-hydroxy-tetrahydrodipicolinate synthase [Verrucomicrobiota bacterium]MCG2679206.1 4-hydroxy-tetrahydrodipicolinate synthase [Kiritimatiellia bacterium]MBU4248599.1 4-hydroxy-tetrahydrodipicolinate synthase [Verrucomicrobiota bacterium]MBU4290061.1 4-hydroxy-tetrahydrodipicolinate synthase [Verrucomicrobiota bacterium]MBU4428923.1 4-hydroxy-tetrahydrodipicolinate synthase [Verrucomicrobiota bacterium]
MFEGAYTAVVTPFNAKGGVDFGKFKALIERQIQGGIDGIVPVGTTGESPTLNCDEHKQVIKTAVEACRGRIKVIAGAGANSTSEAIELTRFALDSGADGTLQVAPYYNKPNQEGLYRHFSTIADIGLPVVLYNIPGRTGVEIALDTVFKLAKHPRIAAVKEAAGNVSRVSQITMACNLCVLSGDDPLTLPMMIVGAKGVISVASNVVPQAVADMVHAALGGDWAKASQLHRMYFRLFSDIFLDTNPIPVKSALAMMGQIEEVYRLPLCPPGESIKTKLAECLKSYNLI